MQMSKISNLFSKEVIGITASVISIISFIFAAYVFYHGIESKKKEEKQQKIAVVKALVHELEQVNWVIDRYLGLDGVHLSKLYYHTLPDEVIKHCLTQSWFIASEVGISALEIYQRIKRTNTQLKVQNSPEYVLTSPSDWTERKVDSMRHHQKKMPELKEQSTKLIRQLNEYIKTIK